LPQPSAIAEEIQWNVNLNLNWVGVTGNLYQRHVTEQGLRFGLAYKFGGQ